MPQGGNTGLVGGSPPVHDEIIFQTQADPKEFANKVIEIISGNLGDVPIEAEATIAEGSWGSLYMKDSHLV